MPKPTLFVCQECNTVAEADSKLSQGTRLLNQLNELDTDSSCVIKAARCMWMCEQACAVSLAATDRHTYLFTNLPLLESAEALLVFANLYINIVDRANRKHLMMLGDA